ncbi:MAG: type IV toxin-antitoxin system AbiEi family antitoxin [Gammaproteobacteria bacterium]
MDRWLEAYFRLRGQAYYLGLLSAAAKHGSSQQAVQVVQVITEKPMRPITLSRVRLEFHVKVGLHRTPLAEIRGLPAALAISSAAATALDLTTFSKSVGGMARAVEVIAGLLPAIDAAGLRQALAVEPMVTAKQRMGYIFDILGAETLANIVHQSLPRRTVRIPLQPAHPATGSPLSTRWNVVDNLGLKEQRA